MNANTLTLRTNTPEVALAAFEAGVAKFNAATEHVTGATKAAVMIAAAPLLGLAFVIALPIVSVALAAYYGAKLIAAHRKVVWKHVKNVTLFFVSPFFGLAYILAMPVVGIATLAYYAVKAARK